MRIIDRRFRSWLLTLRDIPGYYVRAATEHGFHPLAAVRALYGALRERYTPQEAYKLGLLRPGSDARTDRRFLSTSRMTAIQMQLNPVSWRLMLDDKAIFYRFCAGWGLPVPRLLGIFFRKLGGWSHVGGSPAGREAWVRFFEHDCPGEFVVKPSLGRSGRGVRLLQREGSVFRENGGRTIDAPALYGELMEQGSYDSFVIQERVRNHPVITGLGGAEGLQTARVFSAVDRTGKAEVIYAYFKPIVGRNVIDNYVGGTTGNLIARIRLETGTLYPAVGYTPGSGFESVPAHPGSGQVFEGFRLPLWEELRAMVCDAAIKFHPLRSIGWDVAIAPDGPVLIEGNYTPDPPTSGACMEEFLAALPRV